MKRIIFVCMLFITLFLFGCTSPSSQSNTNDTDSSFSTTKTNEKAPITRKVINYADMKAIWLSQFDLVYVYTDNGAQRNKDDFEEKISVILNNVKNDGFNTVLLQVRPNCDSFYPSEYFPASKYVTGDYGQGFTYDCIEIIVDIAHCLELSVHAWINPLRCMSNEEILKIDDIYPIKKFYNSPEKKSTYLVKYNDRYYLNPAYCEVREYIVSGVSELLKKYNFDGCHMDDYFYPTDSEAFDKDAFENYKLTHPASTLEDFRYTVLNKLISDIYKTVKTEDKNLIFGISPEGNIYNASKKAFADVYTWCSEEGYIDYICPQVYFGFEHSTHPFNEVCQTWQNIITNKKVKLIIGVTFRKALSEYDQWAGDGKYEWRDNKNILERCLLYTKNLTKCRGVSVFSYQFFYDAQTNKEISETKLERDSFIKILKKISWQVENY